MSTAISPIPTVPTGTVASPIPHRFSVDDYVRMHELEILKEEDRCELIFGEVVQKMTQGHAHCSSVARINRLLIVLFNQSMSIRPQCAMVIIKQASMPEPDFVIADGPDSTYDLANPVPNQVHFIIEVSDSSLSFDRNKKYRLYAAAQIPVYWIVNLVDRQLEVYTDPIAGTTPKYTTRTDYDLQSQVPVVIAGQTVGNLPVKEMFPS